ncbi:ECF transporter S component [Bacillota bacterium LX-D]|nr:ECF transporter S component [Bacillota bacterium LX-D]
MSTKKLVRISLLAVISFLLMFTIEFPIPFFPPYLKYDPSEIPALIAAFAWGPWIGVLVEFLKNFLFFISGRSTAGIIGVVAAFLAGGTFVLVAGSIYEHKKTLARAIIALFVGSIAMTAVMTTANYFVLLPLWGIPTEKVLPLLTSAIIPFNLLKAAVSSLATFVIYKKVHSWLEFNLTDISREPRKERS